MYRLNNKIKNLKPYDPVAGDYKIRLDANESFINPGIQFLEKIKSVMETVDFNRYPDPSCLELRKAFAKAYNIKQELVMAGNGSDEIITVLLSAFLENGDKVATLEPDFSMYGFYCGIYERENIVLSKGDDLKINVDKLIEDINKVKPEALIFSNPCSPTSLVLSKEDVRKIANNTETLLILDEAYMEFSNESLIEEVENFDNLVVLKTCSKAWGLAAIRLGFAISNKTIVEALNGVRSPYNINSVTQAIGVLVLSDKEYIDNAKNQILEQRNELYNVLSRLKNKYIIIEKNKSVEVIDVVKPETNFILLKFKNGEESKAVYERLLSQGIIVRILGAYLRITAGNKDENSALEEALKIER